MKYQMKPVSFQLSDTECSLPLGQFSNFSMQRNPLQSFLIYRFLGSIPRETNSGVGGRERGRNECAFPTSPRDAAAEDHPSSSPVQGQQITTVIIKECFSSPDMYPELRCMHRMAKWSFIHGVQALGNTHVWGQLPLGAGRRGEGRGGRNCSHSIPASALTEATADSQQSWGANSRWPSP